MDYDDAYANGAHIEGAEAYPPRWEAAALHWREVEQALGRARLNQPYGPGVRQRFDLFLPAGRPQGVVVFVHGGYWRAFDNKSWSHLAAGAQARGWAVAMPAYTLAPAARIGEITREIAAALGAIGAQVAGPMVLSGHSAGAHLVARMLCRDVALPAGIEARLARVVPISPLGDLRPLLRTTMNADLRLDGPEAAAESPLLCCMRRDVAVMIRVGAQERPAFLQQARDLAAVWQAPLQIAPGCHHFNVIDALAQPDSALVKALTEAPQAPDP